MPKRTIHNDGAGDRDLTGSSWVQDPQETFTLSGTEALVFDEQEDPLKALKEAYNTSINIRDTSLKKLEAAKKKQDDPSKPIDISQREHPLHQFAIDIFRNDCIIEGIKYPPTGTGAENQALMDQRLQQFNLIDPVLGYTHYELAELHQGNGATLMLLLSDVYKVGGKSAKFLPLDAEKKMLYEKNGDVYSFKFSAPFIANIDGQFHMMQNNKIVPVSVSSEIFENIVMNKPLNTNEWQTLAEASVVTTVDLTGVPPGKPKFSIKVEMESNHPSIKYMGPAVDPDHNVTVEIKPKKPARSIGDKLRAFFTRTKAQAAEKLSEVQQIAGVEGSQPMQEANERQEEPGRQEKLTTKPDKKREQQSHTKTTFIPGFYQLSEQSFASDKSDKSDKKSWFNKKPDFHFVGKKIELKTFVKAGAYLAKKLENFSEKDPLYAGVKVAKIPTKQNPEVIIEVANKQKLQSPNISRKKTTQTPQTPQTPQATKPPDKITCKHALNKSVEITVTPDPSDQAIFVLLSSFKGFTPLTMDPYYQHDPLVTLKMYEGIKLSGLNIKIHPEDLEKLASDEHYGPHFNRIKDLGSAEFYQFMTEPRLRTLGSIVEKPKQRRELQFSSPLTKKSGSLSEEAKKDLDLPSGPKDHPFKDLF